MEANINLKKISNIYEYFDALANLTIDNFFILMAVKDTPVSAFNERLRSSFISLGLKESIVKEEKCGYIAIINNKDVIYEYCGGKSIAIKCNLEIDGYSLDIQSKPILVGNRVMIIVGSAQCAVDSSGINIVVFDKNEQVVIDSVCFDTRSSDYKISRKDCSSMKKYFFKNKMSVAIDNVSSRGIISFMEKFDTVNTQNDLKYWQLYKKDLESVSEARRRFFKGLECTDYNMQILQKCISILFYYFDKICKNNDIKYFISNGSLIGAIRHGGCIPWDDDIDVWLDRKEMKKLPNILKDYENFELSIYYDSRAHIRVNRFKCKDWRIPCFIDIFVTDYVKDSSDDTWNKHKSIRREMCSALAALDKKIALDDVYKSIRDVKEVDDMFDSFIEKEQVTLNPDHGYNAVAWSIDNFDFRGKNVFDYDWIFPTRTVPFGYGTCEIPARAEDILKIQYGDIYTISNDMHRHVTLNENSVNAMEKFIADNEQKIEADKE